MGPFGTGQAIRRKEDQRFLTGAGRYTDDVELKRQTYLYLFRSPYAHGAITHLDVAAAKASPGVLAIYTADDLTNAGVRDIVGSQMPPGPSGEPKPPLEQRPLARDRVRYVGEPVVGVVAESLTAAKDAAELVEFDVEELQAVVSIRDALADGAPSIHDIVPGNHYGVADYGDRSKTDAAFATADETVRVEVVNNRLAPTAMEPRGCNISFNPDDGMLTVYQGCQGVHALRARIARSLGLDSDEVHVISPDVGGAFGLKFFLQCESVVAGFASMRLGRPVKWIADRNESFLSDVHGRDHVSTGEMALDADGRFLAMRVSIKANLRAYCSQAGDVIPWFGACMTTGTYDIPTAYADITMVVTNTVPVDAYRGAGRPEAAYLVERLVDAAARKVGLSPDEIRRRNLIEADRFPYRTPTGRVYDSGEYATLMDAALRRADWRGFEQRRRQSADIGRLRGIGMSYYVEICSAMGGEDTYARFEEDGRVTVLMGTQSSGQGHETSYAQMVAAGLGIDIDSIDVIQGDSRRIPTGEGTGGSRSMVIGGSALFHTVNSMIEAGRAVAAELLEAAVVDIEFDGGTFRITGTDRAVTMNEVARASYDDSRRPAGIQPGLSSSEKFTPEGGTFPNGCHVCEVEIDPDTGVIDILRYTIEDDVGVVINPLILEGQIVGGVAQGLGQACGEHAVYDSDGGQLLSATFMDYPMPRADWMPDVDFRYTEVASPRNPLGVKGAGEAGTVGSTPALVNAVIDALSTRGIEDIDMPVTPLRVWQALQVRRAASDEVTVADAAD